MSNQKSPVLPHVKDETVLEPFRYISTVPGKDVRGKLIDCFQLWFHLESETVLQSIKEIIGDLHNASLLVDDIEDNSSLRRGIPGTNDWLNEQWNERTNESFLSPLVVLRSSTSTSIFLLSQPNRFVSPGYFVADITS